MTSKAVAKSKNPGGVSKYSAAAADRVCQTVASGETLTAGARAAGVGLDTITRWLRRHEPFRKALDEALKASALVLEDKCLAQAMRIVNGDIGQSPARGITEGLKHLRWVLSRRDPGRYGERRELGSAIQVIIHTNLALNGEERPEDDGQLVSGEYTVAAPAPQEEDRDDGGV